ncbi:MAG: GNAT family N-acetyltransferase [Candidatus Odinarchaeota archaeon]
MPAADIAIERSYNGSEVYNLCIKAQKYQMLDGDLLPLDLIQKQIDQESHIYLVAKQEKETLALLVYSTISLAFRNILYFNFRSDLDEIIYKLILEMSMCAGKFKKSYFRFSYPITLSTETKKNLLDQNFNVLEEHKMSLDLNEYQAAPVTLPNGYEFREWQEKDRKSTLQVIFDGLQTSIDSEVFYEFRSIEGINSWYHLEGKEYQPDLYINELSIQLCHNSTHIGACIVTERDKDLYLSYIALKKPYQGKKLGKKLLSHVLNIAKGSGHEKIALHVIKTNSRAYRLYQKLGYRIERKAWCIYKDFY